MNPLLALYPYGSIANDSMLQTTSIYFRRVVRLNKEWPLFSRLEKSINVSIDSKS